LFKFVTMYLEEAALKKQECYWLVGKLHKGIPIDDIVIYPEGMVEKIEFKRKYVNLGYNQAANNDYINRDDLQVGMVFIPKNEELQIINVNDWEGK
jgi:hypothetical protein